MSKSTASDVVLNPAVRVLWRGSQTVQLELADRALVLDGVDAATLRTLLGRQAPGAARRRLAGPGVLEALTDGGFVWPRGAADPTEDPRLAPPRARLAPELGALSARYGEPAAELLHARRGYAVAVQGAGRVAGHLAVLLAAAGVGRVYATDDGDARLAHSVPGGLRPDDEGRRFATAVATAVARAASEVDTTPLPSDQQPDLVILAVDEPIDPDRRAALHAWDRAHLAVQVGTEQGVVGPLVIPGLTSCLHCADLHRLDRDPAWSAIAVQLGVPRPRNGGCDVAATTVIAGVAALQALAFLDGGQPDTIEATIELHLPDWRLRRRSWPVHPSCDCTRETRASPAAG